MASLLVVAPQPDKTSVALNNEATSNLFVA